MTDSHGFLEETRVLHPRSKFVKNLMSVLAIVLFIWTAVNGAWAQAGEEVVLQPRSLGHSVRNPLNGWRGTKSVRPWIGESNLMGVTDPEFGTLIKWYIGWNELESTEADGPEKMKAFFNAQWKGLPERNIRVIPRLTFIDHVGRYIPKDLPDLKDYRESPWYTNAAVQARTLRLITRFAEAVDQDPRVAYVEMGIQGKYAEQWGLEKMPEYARWLYETFSKAFKNKKVMVRNVGTPGFGADTQILKTLAAEYPFGFYQDSFGMAMYRSSIDAVAKLDDGRRWEKAVMGGEIRTWKNPIMTASNTASNVSGDALAILVNWARFGHFTFMGWDGNQFQIGGHSAEGGEAVRAALGYHFTLPEVKYPGRVTAGGNLPFAISILNRGSAPFYYYWPVEVSLVVESNRRPVATKRVEGFDLTRVMPGTQWDENAQSYRSPAVASVLSGSLNLPVNLPDGNYILTLAILDPEGGLKPNVRLEIENYWKGGLHPLGRVRVGKGPVDPMLNKKDFFMNPIDDSISYEGPK